MANPNIVNVTSIYGESIMQTLTTDVTVDVLVVQTDRLLKINSILVGNNHATNGTAVSVRVVKIDFTSAGVASGDDNAGIMQLASTINCPANDTLVVITEPIYLMEGDTLEAGCNPATAEIFVSYEVINDA